MKKTKFLTLLVVFLFFSNTYAAIDWEYPSPLTVVETITNISPGEYQYEYSFTNVDTSVIWYFGVFTEFTTVPENTFTGHNWLGPYFYSIDSVIPEHDARNLNPDIYGLTLTDYEPHFPSRGIQINEFAYGFSFTSFEYDPLPKLYFYHTIDSGVPWDNKDGKVAAVGTTIPEPCNLLLFTLGGIWLRRRLSKR